MSSNKNNENKSIYKLLDIVLIIIALFTVLVGSRMYFRAQDVDHLLSLATPLQEKCNSNTGCIYHPNGWGPTTVENVYEKQSVTYVSQNDSFEMWYHISLDTWLHARGGKGKNLVVFTVYE